MRTIISVGAAKSGFSDLMSRVVYKGERFVIQRRGRPMVAVVSIDDLKRLEESSAQAAEPGGALALVGAWADVDKLDELVAEIYAARERDLGRPVSLED